MRYLSLFSGIEAASAAWEPLGWTPVAFAEINAIKFAGKAARGATLYVHGHTYVCQSCLAAAREAGIANVVIGVPPGSAKDGPRYKAIGNSMAVPVINWIGRSIEVAMLEFWQE